MASPAETENEIAMEEQGSTHVPPPSGEVVDSASNDIATLQISDAKDDDDDSREKLARRGSLLDDDEEEEEEEGEDGNNDQQDNVAKQASPPKIRDSNALPRNAPAASAKKEATRLVLDGTAPETTPSSNRGAQILMNRFSSWRQKANETMSRNAQVVLKSNFSAASPTSFFGNNSRERKPAADAKDNNNHNNENNTEEVKAEEEKEVLSQSSANERSSPSHSSNNSSSSSTLEEEGTVTEYDDVDEDKKSSMSESNTNHSHLAAAAAATEEEPPRMAAVAKVAASVVADTVASGFRGRYSGGRSSPPPPVEPPPKMRMVPSQTALILQSRAASYMQSILDSLEPHEYVMLLGNGMLGVNLKQTFLKHHGVYVDYLVRGGAADISEVVSVGDSILKVGSVNVQRGTIWNIPRTIADAKRPVVLVFSTGQRVSAERMNYVDVAVSMMHKIREDFASRRHVASLPPPREKSGDKAGVVGGEPAVAPQVEADDEGQQASSEDENGQTFLMNQLNVEQEPSANQFVDNTAAKKEEKQDSTEEPRVAETVEGETKDDEMADDDSPTRTSDLLPPPTDDVLEERMSPIQGDETDVSDDNNGSEKEERAVGGRESTDIPILGQETGAADDGLENELDKEKKVDWTMHSHSFDCVNPMSIPLPPREVCRILSVHGAKRCNDKFTLSILNQTANSNSNFRAALQNAFSMCALDGRRLPFLSTHFSSEISFGNDEKVGGSPPKATASTQLMLFLELSSFIELHGVASEIRRIDLAKKIAYKFFLPSKIGNHLEPPMFDFHHIVPDSDLRHLEQALTDSQKPLPRNLFIPFSKAVMETLSGYPFITFLVSDECARMRAYLRNTSPFVTVCPRLVYDAVIDENGSHSMQNLFLYLLMHLICQVERSIGGENDDLISEPTERVADSAGGIVCAVYIKRHIQAAVVRVKSSLDMNVDERKKACLNVIAAFEHLWEAFVAPAVGMLDGMSSSNELDDAIQSVRRILVKSAATFSESDNPSDQDKLVEALTSSDLLEALDRLVQELLYGYATSAYQKFKEHKFHEWMCDEFCKATFKNETEFNFELPRLPVGCISRLLRRAELPAGVSAHKPLRKDIQNSEIEVEALPKQENGPHSCEASGTYPNAEFAVVFGTDDGTEVSDRISNPAFDRFDIRRYVCENIFLGGEHRGKSLKSNRLPDTLESYATVPMSRRTLFSSPRDSRTSADGWEISIVNFMIPNADSSSGDQQSNALYGVSLVFQRNDENYSAVSSTIDVVIDNGASQSSRTPEKAPHTPSGDEAIDLRSFVSPVNITSPAIDFSTHSHSAEPTREKRTCSIRVPTEIPNFCRRLKGDSWSQRVESQRNAGMVEGPLTIGLALVSRQNVVLAMRETLSHFLFDQCRSSNSTRDNVYSNRLICSALVDLLGNFSHEDVEREALKYILEPYVRFCNSPWIDRPLRSQREEFEMLAGQQLTSCLPAIPLALLFVAILLEQKVVLSCSGRSMLFSAVATINGMLSPLQWCHLLVPLVPSALARDLLQYPAPFILGLHTEDEGTMELLNSLPKDVTLVDLDVGRVILAPSFAHDDELLRGSEDRDMTAAALRSQVLYLAQSLGTRFGAELHPHSWRCDDPWAREHNKNFEKPEKAFNIEKVRSICRMFLVELLEGTPSCCYWIEEKHESATIGTDVECTVLFDEDRFFHIKNMRSQGRYAPLFDGALAGVSNSGRRVSSDFAMSLDDFDLIIESFLRCQSLNTYISSCDKTRMAFY